MTDNLQKEAQELYPLSVEGQIGAAMHNEFAYAKQAAYLAGRKKTIEENERLREENYRLRNLLEERYKGLVSAQYYEIGKAISDEKLDAFWQQFKKDNGL